MNSGKPTSEAFGAGAGRERQGQPESKLHRERLKRWPGRREAPVKGTP
jgi:hypothetical protein